MLFRSAGHTIAEIPQLAAVICGERRAERWSTAGKSRPLDYYEARGVIQSALSALAVPIQDRPLDAGSTPPELLHPGRSASLVLEGRAAGWFGQLHPGLAERLDLPSATYLMQLNLNPLLTAAARPARLQPSFSPFATVPFSERDLALVVPRTVTAAELVAAIRKAGKPLLEIGRAHV